MINTGDPLLDAMAQIEKLIWTKYNKGYTAHDGTVEYCCPYCSSHTIGFGFASHSIFVKCTNDKCEFGWHSGSSAVPKVIRDHYHANDKMTEISRMYEQIFEKGSGTAGE